MQIPNGIIMVAGLLLLSTGIMACERNGDNSKSENENGSKMDAALRLELHTNSDANNNAMIVVFAKVTDDSDTYVSELEDIEVYVQNRAESIWTLRGTAPALIQASEKAFITRMELSQQRH